MLVYELIKASNDDEVKKFFDDTFERYVGELLDAAGLDPWKACDLENLFSVKTPDFIISCDDKSIFVEAKSIRLGNLPIACPTSVHIPKDLHNTVIKAMEQGFEFGAALYDKCLNPNFFLVIVTYDDLYLGPPEAAWERYFSKYFDSSKYGFDVTGIIDPGKVFIVGIVRVHVRGVNSEVGQGERDIPLPLGESAEVVIGPFGCMVELLSNTNTQGGHDDRVQDAIDGAFAKGWRRGFFADGGGIRVAAAHGS